MTEKFTCDDCGREFDSKRGLHIHQSQKHIEEAEEEHSSSEDSTEEGKKAVFNFDNRKTVYASFLIGVLLGGFLIGGLNALNTQGVELPSVNNDSSSDRIQFASSNISDDPTLGSSDASVRVIMVTDYGCPWCAEWMGAEAIPDDATRVDGTIDNNQNYQKLKQNYIDTGDIQFTVMDYPAHPNALQAHKASNCIYEQDSSLYSEFSKALYERRTEWLGGDSGQDMPDQTFRSIAQNVGANVTAMEQCISTSGNSEIQNDVNLVRGKVDRIGTPLFFIGSEDSGYVSLSGAQSYDTMSKIIDREIQNQG